MNLRKRVYVPLMMIGALAGGATGEAPAIERKQSSARPRIVESLRADAAAERHPADGGGKAWIDWNESGPDPIEAGANGRWTIVYEAGPKGVAEDGAIYLLVSPFWGWSPPQTVYPDAPGYTTLATSAGGIRLEAGTPDRHLLPIHVRGRALREGEGLRLVYGAGAAKARADRFAEDASTFWIGVDGDGDGVRGYIAESPTVRVVAGPAASLRLVLPSTTAPGAEVEATLAVLDRAGNTAASFAGKIAIEAGDGLASPAEVEFRPEDRGARKIPLVAEEPGVYRLRAQSGVLRTESNPMVVHERAPRILWADLHGHSGLSDGTGTPDSYYRYARDVAGLDIAALTDHDHWGVEPLASHPKHWNEIRRATAAHHAPGRFATLLGYEWTSWIYGHRHVLYFGEDGRIFDSVDRDYESPQQLWAALRGQAALTFAHHSAGGPIATNWSIPPDPVLEPLTEVVSVHGSSEAADSPLPIYDPVPGNFVRDALGHGYRLGFAGSGDSHDGHPGLAHLAGGAAGGLTAVFAEERTRTSVLKALRGRRTYATSGERIFLRVWLGEDEMGSTIGAKPGREQLRVRFATTAPARRADVITNGEIVARIELRGREGAFERPAGPFQSGDYLYVRLVQADGHAAWSSPIFVE